MDIVKLEKALATLKTKHEKYPTHTSIEKLDAARLELYLALMAKAEKHIRWSGAKLYSQKAKIGFMLASKLSLQYHAHTLPQFRVAG